MIALVACVAPLVRPAHSLGEGQWRFSALGLYQPALGDPVGAYWPVGIEGRVGLGRRWELGLRGRTFPAADLKYTFVEEGRAPVSLAADVEVGGSAWGAVFYRGDPIVDDPSFYTSVSLLASTTRRLGANVAVRPILNLGAQAGLYPWPHGWTGRPWLDGSFRIGGALELPFRQPEGRALGPHLGAVHEVSGRDAHTAFWFGLVFDAWIDP